MSIRSRNGKTAHLVAYRELDNGTIVELLGNLYYYRDIRYFNSDMSKWDVNEFFNVDELVFDYAPPQTEMLFIHCGGLN